MWDGVQAQVRRGEDEGPVLYTTCRIGSCPRASNGWLAWPDALSRAGIKEHPEKTGRKVHEGNLSYKLTCAALQEQAENHLIPKTYWKTPNLQSTGATHSRRAVTA